MAVRDFAAQLAPVLGNEQALTMVQAAVGHLGHREAVVAPAQQRAILAWLGEQPGVVGAAARHLLRGFDAADSTRPPAIETRRVSIIPPNTVTRAELVSAFERSAGTERAREIVDKACRARGVVAERMPLEAAAGVLEELATTPGLVGVAARFAKARLVLR